MQTENALRERTELLASVIAHVPHGVYWKNRDLVYLGCNDQYARIARRAGSAEVIGRSDLELGWDEADVARLRAADERVLVEGAAVLETTETLWGGEGGGRVFSASRVPLRDSGDRIIGVLGIFSDITERCELEAARRAKEEAELICSALPSAIFTVDAERRVTSWNEKAAQLTGYSADEVIGQSCSLFCASPCGGMDDDSSDGGSYTRVMKDTFIRRKDGCLRAITKSSNVLRDADGRIIGGIESFEDVTERREVHEELLRIRVALNDASDAIVLTDLSGNVTYVNLAFGALFRYTLEMIDEVGINAIFADQNAAREVLRAILESSSWTGEVQMVSREGGVFPAYLRATPICISETDVNPIGVLLIINDMTERKHLETQLLQSQKLEAIGRLAAGVAHEINTPMQYVGDNAEFLKDGFHDLLKLFAAYRRLFEAARRGPVPDELVAEIEETIEDSDVDYLAKEIPLALEQSLEGITRVSEIIRAMKEFSRLAGEDKVAVDINEAINNTIVVARNEWKYVADLVTDLDPDLPKVPCLVGEFNQVMLNLLVNAAHAIGDVVGDGSRGKGTITVSTRRCEGGVEVRVADTGTGIAEAIRSKVFDPFFTTKAVGKGTGQGLAIAHSVIVEKHGGTITFETEEGRGTTFIVRLPLIAAGAGEAKPT